MGIVPGVTLVIMRFMGAVGNDEAYGAHGVRPHPAWASRLSGRQHNTGGTLRGFKNFIMRGDVIVVAVGLVIALAFSNLITAFTTYVINPIVTRFEGGGSIGLGVQLGTKGNTKTFVDFGSLISAIIYFLIFMTVVYFVIVVPYKHVQSRLGRVVFGDPPAVKTCPECLSDDLPPAAHKCKYCGSDQPPVATNPLAP
jgi:large conductance mechanosensitive channel